MESRQLASSSQQFMHQMQWVMKYQLVYPMHLEQKMQQGFESFEEIVSINTHFLEITNIHTMGFSNGQPFISGYFHPSDSCNKQRYGWTKFSGWKRWEPTVGQQDRNQEWVALEGVEIQILVFLNFNNLVLTRSQFFAT